MTHLLVLLRYIKLRQVRGAGVLIHQQVNAHGARSCQAQRTSTVRWDISGAGPYNTYQVKALEQSYNQTRQPNRRPTVTK